MQHIYMEGNAVLEVEEYDELDFEDIVLEAGYYETGYCHSCQINVTRSQVDRDECGICGAHIQEVS